MHCALHGGSMEVLVTQGDTIYISEAEAVCTRTAESRAEYVAQLRLQSAKRSNSTDSAQDGKHTDAAATMHPLLVPQSSSVKSNRTLEEDDGMIVLADDAHLTACSRISDTYDRCSEVKGTVEGRATASQQSNKKMKDEHEAEKISPQPSADNSKSKSKSKIDCISSATPIKARSESTSTDAAAFFDPLLRPPPKVAAPWSTALLVLVPLMLGIHSVNQEYIEVPVLHILHMLLLHYLCIAIT